MVARFASIVAVAALLAAGLDGAHAAGSGDSAASTGTGTATAGKAGASNTAGSSEDTGAITAQPHDTREALETAATKLLNDARAQPRNCGAVSFDAAPPLRWHGALAAAAASHSLWMQATDSTHHEQADGSRVGERAEAAGYRWQAIAENIAAGQSSFAEVVAGWLDSPPHCENIMNPQYEEFAVARVDGTARNRFPTWWTLVLARPDE